MPAIRKIRKNKKTKRKRSNSMSSYGAVGGFPAVAKRRFKYCDELSLDCAASDFVDEIYRANGVSDPEEAIGGHSPMGYNTYKSLYAHVKVDKCIMTVSYVGNGGTASVIPSYYGILLSPTSGGTSGFTAITDIFENKNITNPRICGNTSWQPGDKGNTITKTYIAKRFDLANPGMDNSTGSAVAALPEIDSFFTLYTASINASNGGECNFLVTLDYYVTFTGLKLQAQNA